jgi:hypothetical protein
LLGWPWWQGSKGRWGLVFGVLRLLACHGGEGVTELITCFFFFGSVLVLVLVFVASC